MNELIVGVDWLPVIVGAIAAFALGAAWYSQSMFGKKWIEGSRIDPSKGSPMRAIIAQGAGTFFLSWLIGITAREEMLMTAILVAITAAILIKANGLFAQKSTYAIVVESTFVLAMVVVMIATHAIL